MLGGPMGPMPGPMGPPMGGMQFLFWSCQELEESLLICYLGFRSRGGFRGRGRGRGRFFRGARQGNRDDSSNDVSFPVYSSVDLIFIKH